MQACTQWTHSDVSSQLPTTPECIFKIGDQQSEKKLRNCDRRAICNATRGIDAGHGVIRHRGISDGSDGARPLWRSHSARTEMFFADQRCVLTYRLSTSVSVCQNNFQSNHSCPASFRIMNVVENYVHCWSLGLPSYGKIAASSKLNPLGSVAYSINTWLICNPAKDHMTGYCDVMNRCNVCHVNRPRVILGHEFM